MVRVYAAANLAEAHMIAALLAQAGMTPRIFNENALGAAGDLPMTVLPEVWVMDERDYFLARAVIGRYEQPNSEDGELPCPACGADNPAALRTCWQCGVEW